MGKREIVELVRLMLDFDPASVGPDEALRGWKEISGAVGFSADTLQRRFAILHVTLPRWGQPGKTTPVFLPRGKIVVLRRLLMADF